MVEDKGLEIVGIYRVPGNSAAVNALTEQVILRLSLNFELSRQESKNVNKFDKEISCKDLKFDLSRQKSKIVNKLSSTKEI